MPRGVRIQGEVLRELRVSCGWSQSELADRAGVSERTVRNAEASCRLGVHAARCIAEALETPFDELTLSNSQAMPRRAWRPMIESFDRVYSQAILSADVRGLLEIAHTDITWFCMTTPRMEFCGQFAGLEGLQSHCEAVHRWLTEASVQAREPQYRTIHGEGDLLYVQGEVRFSAGGTNDHRFWMAKVLRFEDSKIRSVEQFFGPMTGND
jgi:transcriptional regulator with XRE-family HTH domain